MSMFELIWLFQFGLKLNFKISFILSNECRYKKMYYISTLDEFDISYGLLKICLKIVNILTHNDKINFLKINNEYV